MVGKRRFYKGKCNNSFLADNYSDDSDEDSCLKNPESSLSEQRVGCPKEDAINPIDKLYMMQSSYFSQN